MKRLLVSGGGGKFATQVIKFNCEYEIYAPSKQEMSIINRNEVENAIKFFRPDIFLHAAAYTRPLSKHESSPDVSIETNIVGTANVVISCIEHNVKLVYISTDHVYKGDVGNYSENDELLPFNKYGWSKLGGECAVKMYDNSLILRMSMCNRPFPHPRAICDAKKSLIYHDEAAQITLKLLNEHGIINVGGESSTIYEFVKKENKNIDKITLNEIKDVNMPKDTTLNVNKMKNLLD